MNSETKNIIEWIVNKLINVINLEPFRQKVNAFISQEYRKGIEISEVKFNMNFVPQEEEIDFLNNYVFDNLKAGTDAVGEALRGELSRGLMNKETISQLKTRIKSVFKDKKYTNRLKTVMRTEKLRANNYGALQGAQQSGLKVKKYLDVILDNRTSNICHAEHRKYGEKSKAIPLYKEFRVKVDNKTYKSQAPPFHVNCRSTLRFVQQEDIS